MWSFFSYLLYFCGPLGKGKTKNHAQHIQSQLNLPSDNLVCTDTNTAAAVTELLADKSSRKQVDPCWETKRNAPKHVSRVLNLTHPKPLTTLHFSHFSSSGKHLIRSIKRCIKSGIFQNTSKCLRQCILYRNLHMHKIKNASLCSIHSLVRSGNTKYQSSLLLLKCLAVKYWTYLRKVFISFVNKSLMKYNLV